MMKVSHNSRRALLSTVNFAMKPRSPVATTAGTVSSGTIVSLIACPTALNLREEFDCVESLEILIVC
jgi:hypothetical protein